MRVRNVPTNLSDITGRMANGNSMFVFESADLCVVHISHLHHVLAQIRPKLIIPMHYGWFGAVEEFIEKAKALYPIRTHDSDTILFSQAKLPRRTEVLFLKGE